MSALETALILAAIVWLAALSFVVLLLVRQLGLITVRLDQDREVAQPVAAGLEVGADAPQVVMELLGSPSEETPSFVLVLGAVCNPCRDLLMDLHDFTASSVVVALVSGPDVAASALAQLIPASIVTVRDPGARRAVEALRIDATPFVFEIRAGRIAAKAALRGAEHFVRFLHEAEAVTTNELWGGMEDRVHASHP